MTKSQLYQELGLEIVYQPDRSQAVVTARAVQSVSEGGLEPPRPCGH